jgi:hypothetical protein
MAFEVLLTAIALGIGIFFIGIPSYKLFRTLNPPKKNPLDEAKERLEQAKLEAEAARLNKQAEQVYQDLYHETLEDSDENQKNRRL